jgi:hypothetical protein
MRTLLISIVVFCNTIIGFAQMIDLDKGRTAKIEIEHIHGDLTIEGANTDRIFIERVKYNPVPESIREPLKVQGYKNSDLDDLSVQNFGNKLTISPANMKGQFADYRLKVPKDMIISIKTNLKILYKKEWNIGDVFGLVENNISVNGIEGEIIISTYEAYIDFSNISGPITCDLYEGEINASFSKLTPLTKSTISIFEGRVNLFLDKEAKCNVELEIESSGMHESCDYGKGDINSDFDIENVELETPDNLWVREIEKGKAINTKAVRNFKVSGQINGGSSHTFDISIYMGEINLLEKTI